MSRRTWGGLRDKSYLCVLLFFLENLVVLFRQDFKVVDMEDVGYAHEKRDVDGWFFVDTIDVGAVATEFTCQPDGSSALPFHFFTNHVA